MFMTAPAAAAATGRRILAQRGGHGRAPAFQQYAFAWATKTFYLLSTSLQNIFARRCCARTAAT